MNFKEALIAHLQGEMVEVKSEFSGGWQFLMSHSGHAYIRQIDDPNFGSKCEFRIAPRTIFVNGVEVPAPESVAPKLQQYFFCPNVDADDMLWTDYWVNTKDDQLRLERGLVYLNKEDAIARAKAMLLTSDKEDS